VVPTLAPIQSSESQASQPESLETAPSENAEQNTEENEDARVE